MPAAPTTASRNPLTARRISTIRPRGPGPAQGYHRKFTIPRYFGGHAAGTIRGMTSHRLPRLDGGRIFLADGGLETTMIFDEGIELPSFASFVLLRDARGRDALTRYYAGYLELATRHGLGFTLDTPTWRANAGWGAELGLSPDQLDAVNRDAAAFLDDFRRAHETPDTPIALCGTLGPRGDAYSHDTAMSADEAEQFHARQIAAFRETAADFVAAFT